MEPILEENNIIASDLLASAAYHARDAQAQCIDVGAVIFPTGHLIPSDALISQVSNLLYAMVIALIRAIAPDLGNDAAQTQSVWQLLSRSGFLREPALVDFALARCAEQYLGGNIAKNGRNAKSAQLPARLLDDANPHIADAAQILLAAQGMRERSGSYAVRELAPEMLHQSVWRVVAAIQVVIGQRDAQCIDAAKDILARHDERQIARVAARKLIHFLQPNEKLQDVEEAGLDLYVAALAADISLDHDHVLRLITAHSSAPLATMLRARGTNYSEAMDAIGVFNGFDRTPRDVTDFEAGYDKMGQDHARDEITRWSIERAAFLAFPGGTGTAA